MTHRAGLEPSAKIVARPLRHRASRILATLGSLRLAIVLLSLFTVCLAWATLLEARYGARITQDLIYRAWWFALLLAFLSVNVVGAALKKIPWRIHQTGFLITHLGLLLMLAGGLLTALFGEEGQVVLIDTAHASLQAHLGIPNQADTMYLTGVHRLEVYRLKRGHTPQETKFLAVFQCLDRGEVVPAELVDCLDGQWVQCLAPGPFLWHSDEHLTLRLPWALTVLYFLASPWPGYECQLGGKATLTVENYYPHADSSSRPGEPFVPRNVPPAAETAEKPALRCRLSADRQVQGFWVGLDRGAVPVRIANDLYVVRYLPETRLLGFSLALRRARQIRDPGSDRPAWFESEVALTTGQDGGSEDQRIFMNHPLSHGRYKVYQASYRALSDPATQEPILIEGRPVSVSGLAVACDPGLWLKYLGTLVVLLGIATMFYMRAYFFGAPTNVNRNFHISQPKLGIAAN